MATYQGVFVATPSGFLLAGSHEDMHDPRKVEKLMRRGLVKWEKLSAADRLMTKEVFTKAVAELDKVEGRRQFPQDGLVLSVICRDLPRSPEGQAVYDLKAERFVSFELLVAIVWMEMIATAASRNRRILRKNPRI